MVIPGAIRKITGLAGRPTDIRQLFGWADANGKVLMDQGAHAELCAAAAEGVAAQTDFDRELQMRFGR
jgi:hypothetical protein